MPRGDEIVRLPEHLEQLNDAGVDAVIVADLGAFTLAGKYAPNCKRHISTQASISNYVTANAWHDLGASRVILARELSLEEIRTIREKTPADLEIEAFVHGAMCVSYSGRTPAAAPAPSPAGIITPSWKKSVPANISPLRRTKRAAIFSIPEICA